MNTDSLNETHPPQDQTYEQTGIDLSEITVDPNDVWCLDHPTFETISLCGKPVSPLPWIPDLEITDELTCKDCLKIRRGQ